MTTAANRKTKQKGSALLMSLVAVSVLTTMIAKAHLSISRSQDVISTIEESTKKTEYLLAGEAWIEQKLIQNDWNKDGDLLANIDFDLDDGELRIEVIDYDACFNINKLSDENSEATMEASLSNLSNHIGTTSNWIGVLKDWVDLDRQTSITGAEDEFYLAKASPHRTANSPIIGDYEWRILDLDDILFAKVVPFLCAHGDIKSTININTAPIQVLMAAIPNLSINQAKLIIEKREIKAFSDLSEINDIPGLENIKLKDSELSTKTKNVFGLIKLSQRNEVSWMQTLVSIDRNNVVKSNDRAMLPPNKYTKIRFGVEDE